LLEGAGFEKTIVDLCLPHRSIVHDNVRMACRMLKKAVQQKKTVIWFVWSVWFFG
jgi:hypothetical protein